MRRIFSLQKRKCTQNQALWNHEMGIKVQQKFYNKSSKSGKTLSGFTDSSPRQVVVSGKCSSDFPLKQNRVVVIWLNFGFVFALQIYSKIRHFISDRGYLCFISARLPLYKALSLEKQCNLKVRLLWILQHPRRKRHLIGLYAADEPVAEQYLSFQMSHVSLVNWLETP